MWVTQSLGRVSLSLIVVGALCGACDDGDDPSSTADEQGEADAGAKTERAGSSAPARAGRGGSAASTSNNSAAGRAGAGQAGRRSAAAGGGAGGAGTAGAAGAAGASTAGAAGAIDPERVSLSDGQIVAVLAAVNATEVSLGTLATSRGVAPGVRNLGESMVTTHNTAQERQTRLAMTLDLESEVSELSTQLGEDAKSLMAELEAADAAEFDALYLRAQIDGHMKVLMLVSERLIPSVKADELRDELMLVRMEVATHLEGARNASAALEDTDAGAP